MSKYNAVSYNVIYVFSINDEAHKGKLKIGKTSFDSLDSIAQLPPNCPKLQQASHQCIMGETHRAMVDYKLEYCELAVKNITMRDGSTQPQAFWDHDVKSVLIASGYKYETFNDTGRTSEWFIGDLETAKKAIKAVKDGLDKIPGEAPVVSIPVAKKTITLRDEQERNVEKTINIFKHEDTMLWDCKMRYGKTVTAYEVIRRMNEKNLFKKVIVITHRPAVLDGWGEDHDIIFNGINHKFIDKTNGKTEFDSALDAANDRDLQLVAQSGVPFVYFSSIQDLRGSQRVGGKFNKNNAVFDMDWDLLIIDEAHEGTRTDLGEDVIKNLRKENTKVLSLSGTPYNIMQDYDDNVFTWTYVDEQKAKKKWADERPNEKNPYEDLPTMNIFTFDIAEQIQNSYRYVTEDMAFNFREFFRTWTGDKEKDYRDIPQGARVGDFVYQSDVDSFLKLISEDNPDSNYPFSTSEYREMFAHTFWMVPGVAAAKALSARLQDKEAHPRFADYHIVNIAGDGDEEQPYDEALNLVKSSIKSYDKTITISCGKLTTGVTVREWTGIMMLSGSSSTSAGGYMQAIFRVQSPGFVNGKQKTNCYVFDFAPDRALKVVAEVHHLRQKRGASDDEKAKQALGEFLNFCPIIAVEGNIMRTYDVPEMMRQIKRISVESAINSGFDDDSIYKTDAGIVMDKVDAEILRKLSDVVAPQKKGKKQNTVVVTDNGMTEEQRKIAEKAKHKPKDDLTEEDKAALEKLKEQKKEQQKLYNLLRAVSIRLPLLFYGADADITEIIHLNDFITLVDDESWQEFMPKGLSKDLFKDILKFYDEDVITGAGLRIRKLAKAADELPPVLRAKRIVEIISKFKNPDKETVLTPWRVVNMHLGDTIGGYVFFDEKYEKEIDEPRFVEQDNVTAEILLNEDARILEMNSKSGLYPLYMTYSLYMMYISGDERKLPLEEAQKVWFNVLDKNIFVLCKTTMARTITIRTLAGYSGRNVNAAYLTKLVEERMKDIPRLARKLTNPDTWGKEGERMKFDAVVGNPPYQVETTDEGNGKDPIYHYFIDLSQQLSSYCSLIHPARFLFNAGKTPKEWNHRILNNEHFKVVKYFDVSNKVFPTVDIKGGVAITVFNKESNYGAIGLFMKNQEMLPILKKVTSQDFSPLSKIVYPNHSYRFTEQLYADNPWAENRLSEANRHNVTTNAFSAFQELFFESREVVEKHGFYRIMGREKGSSRTEKFINSAYITPADNFTFYKVFLARANGNGDFGEKLVNPLVADKDLGHTDTFISVGRFEEREHASNLLKYIETKFARAMLGTLKVTQDNFADKWANVPIQNFTNSSDIDWTQSVSDIDKQLYQKYNLTEDEIDFIESHVKSMDPTVVSEYDKLLGSSYSEIVEQLLKKYGAAKHSYFKDSSCTIKNPHVSRTDEGLYCHHIDEDKAIMLSNDKFAAKNPFDYQKASRLVYCNLLEHLLLHVKIAENPSEQANDGELPGIGGAINFICKDLNDIYSGKEFVDEWRQKVADRVKDDFDDYIKILKHLWTVVETNPLYSSIITKEMLCVGWNGTANQTVLEALNSDE